MSNPGNLVAGPVGNARAVSHGARSPRLLEPLAAELEAALLANPPPWWGAYDLETVRALAYAQARVERYRGFLADRPVADGRGRSMPCEADLLRWERHADRLRARLGLDPTSRMALAADASIAAKLDAASGAPASGLETLRARGLLRAVEPGS